MRKNRKLSRRKIVAVIPARMASTRFPGKPLAKILGLPMLEHVRRRVSLCDKLSKTVVATCDKEIKDVIERYGGDVVMTTDTHERCTDRVAEAADYLDADIIVNIQGDEPLVMPQMVSQVVQPILDDDNCKCVNLVSPIASEEEFANPNAVKTVIDIKGNVLYFSREPIPSRKKVKGDFKKYKQIGIVVFAKSLLIAYSKMEQTPIEKIESIDMMRLLENGHPIKTVIINEQLYSVDTPQELAMVESIMRKDSLVQAYI